MKIAAADRTIDLRFIFLAAILLLIAYGNSLANPFIWDDVFLIKENMFIKDFKYIQQIFTADIFRFLTSRENAYYRPLQLLTYTVDYKFWGLNPFGYHLASLIWHFFNTLLVYSIADIITKNRTTSFIAGLLFAVHPAHAAAVSYISGRADLISAFFFLSAFILYVKQDSFAQYDKRRFAYYISSVFAFTGAILGKESALIFPAILILWDYCFLKKGRLHRYLPFFAVMLIYIWVRTEIFDFPQGKLFFSNDSFYLRLVNSPKIITLYLKSLFFPIDLHMLRFVALSDNLLAWDLIMLLAAFAGGIFALTVIRKRSMVIFFALVWFFILLLPILNIIVPLGSKIADHWLYLPSAGFFIAIAFGIRKFLESEKKRLELFALGGVTALLVFYSSLVMQRNIEWSDEAFFFKKIINSSHAWDVDVAHCNLARVYYDKNMPELALKEIEKTIEINPLNQEAYALRGIIYGRAGKFAESIKAFEKAIKINSAYAPAYNDLGITYAKMGKMDLAVRSWKKAVQCNPYLLVAQFNLRKAEENLKK